MDFDSSGADERTISIISHNDSSQQDANVIENNLEPVPASNIAEELQPLPAVQEGEQCILCENDITNLAVLSCNYRFDLHCLRGRMLLGQRFPCPSCQKIAIAIEHNYEANSGT
jgi:hypothetical protein